MIHYKTVLLPRKWLNANVSCWLPEENEVSNMLFHLEKWSDVPSDVHFPLSLQLPINLEAVNDKNLLIWSTAVLLTCHSRKRPNVQC